MVGRVEETFRNTWDAGCDLVRRTWCRGVSGSRRCEEHQERGRYGARALPEARHNTTHRRCWLHGFVFTDCEEHIESLGNYFFLILILYDSVDSVCGTVFKVTLTRMRSAGSLSQP